MMSDVKIWFPKLGDTPASDEPVIDDLTRAAALKVRSIYGFLDFAEPVVCKCGAKAVTANCLSFIKDPTGLGIELRYTPFLAHIAAFHRGELNDWQLLTLHALAESEPDSDFGEPTLDELKNPHEALFVPSIINP